MVLFLPGRFLGVSSIKLKTAGFSCGKLQATGSNSQPFRGGLSTSSKIMENP
jgi:hypothetical protein